jgi:hypothetical protein
MYCRVAQERSLRCVVICTQRTFGVIEVSQQRRASVNEAFERADQLDLRVVIERVLKSAGVANLKAGQVSLRRLRKRRGSGSHGSTSKPSAVHTRRAAKPSTTPELLPMRF